MRLIKEIIKSVLNVVHALGFKKALSSGKLNGQLLIIMYHRVLPTSDSRLDSEEPGMFVTPETLDIHLGELKSFSKLVHIEDWLELARHGKLEDSLYCAITFDDGWADNYEFALPLLKKHGAPATVFVATDYIDTETTFWPERLAALLNNFGNFQQELSAFFGSLGQTLDHAKLRAKDKDYFAKLINVTKTLTDDDIKRKLDEIESNSRIVRKTEMLTWKQSETLTMSDIRIGGHTRSHRRLDDKATCAQIVYEVDGCAKDIEDRLGFKPTQFCYPNGDTSQPALRCVENRFNLAVTTQSGLNGPTQNPYTLKRVGVHEDASCSPLKLKAVLARAL